MRKFFKKIRTERFRWYDHIILAVLFSLVLVILGQLLSIIVINLVIRRFDLSSPFLTTFFEYFQTFGSWLVPILYFAVFRHRRPILKAVGTKPKGNNAKYLFLGLLIGFGLNFCCAFVAMLNRDIHVTFNTFDPFAFLALLFAVFVQSSSEELIDRGYLYQVLKKGYRNKWVAIIGNAIVFSMMHALNPGVTILALANIFFSGLMFSMFVYYFDSLWCAFGIHTGWNFTQSILLGLPNSGLVVPYSIFVLDTASASNSFVYNVAFGIEGTVFSTVLLALACVIIFVIGERRGQEPTDIWEPEETEVSAEE